MGSWRVILPVAGYIELDVTGAKTEEEAIQLAMRAEFPREKIDELNAYEHLVEGNVCNAEYNDAEAWYDDSDDGEDEEDLECDGDCANCDDTECDERYVDEEPV